MKVTCAGFAFFLSFLCFLLVAQTARRRQAVPSPSFDLRANPAEIGDALAEICPRNNIIWKEDGTASGCSICPAGTTFQDERGQGFELRLRRATLGHFTSPQAENIILSVVGCEPHSTNFGGSFVFVLESGRPRFLAYNQALITEPCHKLNFPNGRNFLVCRMEWGGQGMQWSYIYSVAFERDGKSEITPIFTTEDTVGTCGEGAEGTPTGPVQRSSIENIRFPDLNGDGNADISITATLGRKLLTAAEQTTCLRAQGKSDVGKGPLRVPARKYEIKFLFDGNHFKVAHDSRTTIKLFPDPRPPFSN